MSTTTSVTVDASSLLTLWDPYIPGRHTRRRRKRRHKKSPQRKPMLLEPRGHKRKKRCRRNGRITVLGGRY